MMGLGSTDGGGRVRVFYQCFLWLLVFLVIRTASADVVLIVRNSTVSFSDMEAKFAPIVKESGDHGVLYLAEPLDACSSLKKKVDGDTHSFALIIRGNCPFDEKVRNAQDAGFKAAVVYDNEYNANLIAMSGSPSGIVIYAVFVARAAGEVLKKYAGLPNAEIWITPAFGYSAWSVFAIIFISLIAVSAVLATCFFAHRHSVTNQHSINQFGDAHCMSNHSVKAMPSMTFLKPMEDNCTSTTCAICLDDYSIGDKLRILPCRHKFHAICVDLWLTSWRTFCPVCKWDARSCLDKLPPSECTPLLPSIPATPSVSSVSSLHSEIESPAIQISPSLHRLTSRSHSLSSTPHSLLQRRSYSSSPAVHASRSSADLRNLSSRRSHAAHLSLSCSLHSPVSSSPTSRFMSYGCTSVVPSPSHLMEYHRHHDISRSSSMREFTAQASAEYLPEC